MNKRRKDLHSIRLPELPPSPLDAFPTKNDLIRKTFLSQSQSSLDVQSSTSPAGGEAWLSKDKIDPNFGVTSTTSHGSMVKAYRRLASSSLFTSASTVDTPLGVLSETSPTRKNFVLVEESKLQELIKLDRALQKEKLLLGEQCLTIFQDQQSHARIPLPATRYAIHNLCETQMNKVYAEIAQLQQQWSTFCRQNHYHKPHLFLKDSYLNVAPPSQRALKLRLVREAVATWTLRRERDTMLFEDDMSFLCGLYYDALQRQRDYERYYIIANRYGALAEADFYKDSRPGKRYFQRITKAAIKMQLLWDRYWAMAKLRRFRACRMIQKHWRRYSTYKKLHPIIRLRLKIGKKTYYMFCFARWKEYNAMCRWIREDIRYFLSNYKERCFFAWKNYTRDTRDARNRRMGKVLLRARQPLVYRQLRNWKAFIKFLKDLRQRMKLLFSFPTFYQWKENTRFSKLVKRLNRMSARIQAGARMMLQRSRFLRAKHVKTYLNLFAYVILAKNRVHRARSHQVAEAYARWKPDEELRRLHRALEQERQRLQRRQLYVQDRERALVRELTEFLSSAPGVKQLELYSISTLISQTTQKKREQPLYGWLFGLSVEEKHRILDTAARRLRDETLAVTRVLDAQAFDSKSPPAHRCPHPQCRGSFVHEDQFRAHFAVSAVHAQQQLPLQQQALSREEYWTTFADMILFLRHGTGVMCLREVLVRQHGLSGVVHVLDCWMAVQEMQRQSCLTTVWYQKLLGMYESFLKEGGSRYISPLELSAWTTQQRADLAQGCERLKAWSWQQLQHQLQKQQKRGGHANQQQLEDAVASTVTFPGYRHRTTHEFLHNLAQDTQIQNLASKAVAGDAHGWRSCFGGGATLPPQQHLGNDSEHGNDLESETALLPFESRLRQALGKEVWTTMFLMSPQPVDELEYALLQELHTAYLHALPMLKESVGYREYQRSLDEEVQKKESQLRQDYEKVRWALVREWARGFRDHENRIQRKAESAVDLVIAELSERLFKLAAKQEVRRKGEQKRWEEQAEHENLALLQDEALYWTEANVVDTLFEFFTRELLKGMWAVPGHRRGMLQYAGLMQVAMKTKGAKSSLLVGQRTSGGRGPRVNDPALQLVVKEVSALDVVWTAEDSRLWFEDFSKQLVQSERRRLPPTKEVAVVRIQRRFRGTQGRNIVRKMFAKRFKKYWDDSAYAFYYVDEQNGESSWSRPFLFAHLYPRVTGW